MFGRAVYCSLGIVTMALFVGCAASSPGRSFFARKAKPSSSEQEYANRLLADAKRMEAKGDRDGAARLRELAEQANSSRSDHEFVDSEDSSAFAGNSGSGDFPQANDSSSDVAISRLDPAKKSRSAGGLFDVPSHPRIPSDEVEAPTPRRSNREKTKKNVELSFDDLIPPEQPAKENESPESPFAITDLVVFGSEEVGSAADAAREQFIESAAASEELSNPVVSADFIESGNGSEIELASGSNRNAGRFQSLPWDRLRQIIQPGRRVPDESISEPAPLPTIQPGRPGSSTASPAGTPRNLIVPRSPSITATSNGNSGPEMWPGRSGQSASVEPQQSTAQGNIVPVGSTEPRVGSLGPSAFAGDFGQPPPRAPQSPGAAVQFNAGASLQSTNPLQAANSHFNQPVTTPPPINGPIGLSPPTQFTGADLEQMIASSSGEVAAALPGDTDQDRQAYLRKHVQLRLLYWIAGQTDRALQPIPGVGPADQEFWQQMLWGIANYFDSQGMPDSSERATQTIAQLRGAALRLQESARLELKNVCFCHKIIGYGNYQRFKRDGFTPGSPVLIYAEVDNFKSEQTSDGQFRTLMKSTVEILDSSGRLIETVPFPPSEDRCRNHRQDYFHSYEFAIPMGLSPGPHVLRMTVEDQLGKKSAFTTLNFTVQ